MNRYCSVIVPLSLVMMITSVALAGTSKIPTPTQIQRWTKSAEKGNAVAQCNVGACYHYGLGVETNYVEAVKWFQKSADQGNAEAQYNLGILYAEGEGVEKNYAEAIKWFRKAAEQGNADAQYNLGSFYARGKGVVKDYQTAYGWLLLAEGGGETAATPFLKTLETKLTPEQQTKARSWVKEWKPISPTSPSTQNTPAKIS